MIIIPVYPHQLLSDVIRYTLCKVPLRWKKRKKIKQTIICKPFNVKEFPRKPKFLFTQNSVTALLTLLMWLDCTED